MTLALTETQRGRLDELIFHPAGRDYLICREGSRGGQIATAFLSQLDLVEQRLLRFWDPDGQMPKYVKKAAEHLGFEREQKHSRQFVHNGVFDLPSRTAELRESVSARLRALSIVLGDSLDPDVWLDDLLSRYASSDVDPEVDAEDPGQASLFPAESWQAVAARIIASVVSRRTLEEALTKQFMNALRRERRQRGGKDWAGTKAELVEALLLQHGQDLLGNSRVLRRAIGNARKVPPPRSFHLGKAAARQFVTAVGLPMELVGDPSLPSPPAVSVVYAPDELKELYHYQKDVRDRLIRALEDGDTALCSLPTGAGKTRAALESLCHEFARHSTASTHVSRSGRPLAIWVAHTEELCEQAAQSLSVVWQARLPGRRLLLINTTRSPRFDAEIDPMAHQEWDAAVLITTPRTGERLLAEGIVKRLSTKRATVLRAVVIDEAHRAAAPTYRKLIESAREHAAGEVALIGLTATPFRNLQRGDASEATAPLRELFGTIVVPAELGDDPKRTLIEQQYLATPRCERIDGIDLASADWNDQTKAQPDEILDKQLAKAAARNPRRRRNVIARIRELVRVVPNAKVLYFGPSVADAQVVAFELKRAGIASGVVYAKTRTSVRRQLIQQFRDGDLQVFCNHEVLTTGFDDPLITHVVVARPTISLVLYEQMVGRGLRGPKLGGTAECVIISVEDRYTAPDGRSAAWKQFRDAWLPYVAHA